MHSERSKHDPQLGQIALLLPLLKSLSPSLSDSSLLSFNRSVWHTVSRRRHRPREPCVDLRSRLSGMRRPHPPHQDYYTYPVTRLRSPTFHRLQLCNIHSSGISNQRVLLSHFGSYSSYGGWQLCTAAIKPSRRSFAPLPPHRAITAIPTYTLRHPTSVYYPQLYTL